MKSQKNYLKNGLASIISLSMMIISYQSVNAATEDKGTLQYTVQSGDTLYSIGQKFNVNYNQIKKDNNLDSNYLEIGQKLLINDVDRAPTGEKLIYTVEAGDNVNSIARKFNMNPGEIMADNDLSNPYLYIGDKLVIERDSLKGEKPQNPDKITYTVKSGDNIYTIAKKYKVSPESIMRENNLQSHYLYIGDKLSIDTTKTVNSGSSENSKYVLEPGTVSRKTYTVQPGDNYYKIGSKYGINYQTLMKRNNAKSPYLYVGDTVLIRYTLEPKVDEKYYGLILNLPEKKLYDVSNGGVIKTYDVAIGRPKAQWQTPTGDFWIRDKSESPTWYVPESIQQEMARQGKKVVDKIPPGPNNPLGNWWMGFGNGIGLHATNNTRSIGYSVSHGCIRMEPSAAKDLFKKVSEGKTPVKIIYQPVKVGMDSSNNVYMEVYGNIYNKSVNYTGMANSLIKDNGLEGNINWAKVNQTLKTKGGYPVKIGQDLT